MKGPRQRHPEPHLLLRFLQGETSLAENRAIVRHLLAGCQECTAVTRPVWQLADLWTQYILAGLEAPARRPQRSARDRRRPRPPRPSQPNRRARG